jgi:arabinogalactan endo-1,4-beta-galactosidase
MFKKNVIVNIVSRTIEVYFNMKMKTATLGLVICFLVAGCQGQSPTGQEEKNNEEENTEEQTQQDSDFIFGADLSYVNQIMDHGGSFRDSGAVENPYKIFSDYGTDVARFRLWHDPLWTAEVYDGSDNPIYNGRSDVTEAIRKAKEQGMAVNLDFHYSDSWADPETQDIPKAWLEITNLEVLKDSVYEYTKQTLEHLDAQGLMPEYVQVGNETNCGLMFTNAPEDFPPLNVCNDNWSNAGEVINSGIQAVRDVAASSDVDTKIILHIAQPENVEWWFENMTSTGGVSDFDIIGFSYYTPWSDVPLDEISDHVSTFRNTFCKQVMVVEAAYPWKMASADNYTNIFGQNSLVDGYTASKKGQRDYMIKLTQEIMDGGGSGVMYWEPAWITSELRTQWGQGSAWENNVFFDFDGTVHLGIEYMTYDYD